MSKNSVVVRSAAELEKKYNFASLLGLKKNVEITAQGIQKIENELNSMLNALVINLKDVLDTQNEISLYFYSGIPTTTNEPYTSWTNPSDHIGDIYYDQKSGYVYQWNGVWEINADPNLVEAMSITNAETDTTTDHERKVFFTTPTIPYSNGDWWIKEDGDLSICQISKTTGVYEETDFINSSNYTESLAVKLNNEITVLKGTVTMISENFAKFTDLATGGSTTISGDNVTTGSIKSENYIADTSGTKIDLTDGSIDSKNFKVDASGNVTMNSATLKNGVIKSDKFNVDAQGNATMSSATLTDGTLKIGSKDILNTSGVLSVFQFQCSGGEQNIGWYTEDLETYIKHGLQILYHIPSNFTVINAYVVFTHIPCKNAIVMDGTENTYNGYARNVKLYKLQNMSSLVYSRQDFVGLPKYSYLPKTEVNDINSKQAFGTNGFTGSTSGATTLTTSNIKDSLTVGSTQMLLIDTSDESVSSIEDGLKKTAMATATLFIIGYYKI